MSDLRPPTLPLNTLDRSSDGEYKNSARIGTPVLGLEQWYRVADACNWLQCEGATLAWWGPVYSISPGAAYAHTFRSYTWPRVNRGARLWVIVVRGAGAHGTFETDDMPAPIEWAVLPSVPGGVCVLKFTETVNDVDPTGQEVEGVLTVDDDSASVTVMSASLHELPMYKLNDAADGPNGIRQHSCLKNHPIYDANAAGYEQRSITGAAKMASLIEGADAARRSKIFDWHLAGGVSSSSGTYSNIFRLNPTAQTRYLYSGQTSRTVYWSAYCSKSGGGSGNVRVTSAFDSSTSELTVTSTGWVHGTVTVATDDPENAYWLRGSTRYALTFELRSPTGTTVVYGICVGER
jgi:hypothetical protein